MQIQVTLSFLQTQSPGRHQLQAQAAFGVRLERLNQELASKTRTIQELNRTVEKLQKERRNMLSVHHPPPESRSTDNKLQQGPTRALGPAAGEAPAGEDRFPTAQYEKTYQPTVFAGVTTWLCLTITVCKRKLKSPQSHHVVNHYNRDVWQHGCNVVLFNR